jgi:secretion/DNA translocation related TadE-like protein
MAGLAGCNQASTAGHRARPLQPSQYSRKERSQVKVTVQARQTPEGTERGSGTVLAAGLALMLMMVMALLLLLAQSAVLASRAAAAADLAALAAADALRGINDGEPCGVAAEVAARHAATVVSCLEGGGQTVEVRTELIERTMLGAASGHARAGPPP